MSLPALGTRRWPGTPSGGHSGLGGGLLIALVAALTFGTSGAFIKPLLDAGWSPAAAVTVRVITGGLILAPLAIFSLRGRWHVLWRGRWRVLGMAASAASPETTESTATGAMASINGSSPALRSTCCEPALSGSVIATILGSPTVTKPWRSSATHISVA